jgi:hypothetical protein
MSYMTSQYKTIGIVIVEGLHLFLREAGTYPCDVNNITLDDANISEMTPSKSIQFFPLPLPLFLLLGEPLVANDQKSIVRYSSQKG